MSSTQIQIASLRVGAPREAAGVSQRSLSQQSSSQLASAQPASSQLAYRIAGISFGMTARDGLRMILDPSLREFAAPRAASDECDVNVRVSLVDSLKIPEQKPLFSSGGLWSLFGEDG